MLTSRLVRHVSPLALNSHALACSPKPFLTFSRGYLKQKRWAEIILLEDHEKLGKKHTLATVRPGYARNFLVPKELAVYATAENRIAYNLTKTSVESATAVDAANSAQREMDDYVSSFVDRLHKTTLKFVRGDPVKPVTKSEVVVILRREYVLPGLNAEQLIFPNGVDQLSQYGEFEVEATLSKNSTLPGVGLWGEFESRNIKPVPFKVIIEGPSTGNRSSDD